jgi:uncharacterized membrane protein
MKTRQFLHQLDHERILAAIREAEARSRGEVRVHVSNQAAEDVQRAAAAQFERLGMTATALRNGVLIYVSPPAQQFAVIGDLAIHERGGPGFWAAVAQAMEEDFRAGRFTDGIVKGVERVGDALATHFPRTDQRDVNELPDHVTED